MDPITSAVATEILKQITVEGTPKFFQRIRKWFYSYDLLIIGQERAGKTSLFNFLQKQLLGRDDDITEVTVDPSNSGMLTFKWVTNLGILQVEFRNISDQAGQIGPHEHAQILIKKKPHFIIIVLDVTSLEKSDKLHESYGAWFNAFCEYIHSHLKCRPSLARRVDRKLQQLIVVLNKVDVLDPESKTIVIDRAKSIINDIMNKWLTNNFSGRVNNFPVLECSLVENPRHGDLADTVERLRLIVKKLVLANISR